MGAILVGDDNDDDTDGSEDDADDVFDDVDWENEADQKHDSAIRLNHFPHSIPLYPLPQFPFISSYPFPSSSL